VRRHIVVVLKQIAGQRSRLRCKFVGTGHPLPRIVPGAILSGSHKQIAPVPEQLKKYFNVEKTGWIYFQLIISDPFFGHCFVANGQEQT
jgi:hypothetical protein